MIRTSEKPQIVQDFLAGHAVANIAARRGVSRLTIETILRDGFLQTIALIKQMPPAEDAQGAV